MGTDTYRGVIFRAAIRTGSSNKLARALFQIYIYSLAPTSGIRVHNLPVFFLSPLKLSFKRRRSLATPSSKVTPFTGLSRFPAEYPAYRVIQYNPHSESFCRAPSNIITLPRISTFTKYTVA